MFANIGWKKANIMEQPEVAKSKTISMQRGYVHGNVILTAYIFLEFLAGE